NSGRSCWNWKRYAAANWISRQLREYTNGMRILGISPLDKESTVSIVEDGKVLFAAGEERFTRKKLQDGFPAEAFEAALRYTGTRAVRDIDLVAYPFLDWQTETDFFTRNLQDEKQFLTEIEIGIMRAPIEKAWARVPSRTRPIHGLTEPNQKMAKPLLNKVFYRLAGAEGVLSRNLAKKGSNDWSRESMKFHKSWQETLEESLKEI